MALPDGSVRIIQDRLAPYRDEDGKATRLLGTVHDITEQRQAEIELTELKRHLQRSIEIERLRLAQELHDVPLQQLYTVIYKLEEMRLSADAADAEALGQLSIEVEQDREQPAHDRKRSEAADAVEVWARESDPFAPGGFSGTAS